MNNENLCDYLKNFITDNKAKLFDQVIAQRTRYFTVALEDIYQPHNASAVLRTCDCFGVQDVHIIENRNTYNINPDVSLGSWQWLNLIKYNSHANNTLKSINSLRNKGYRIVATTPHKKGLSLNDFDISKGKTALFFGTEMNGVSDILLENADEYLKIPMYGFTESFNISVSAAVILHYLTTKLRNSDINWQLSKEEQFEIKLNWLKSSIKKSSLLIDQFKKNR